MASFQQPVTFNTLFHQALERMRMQGDSFVIRVFETAGMVWYKYDVKNGRYTLFKVSNDRDQPLDLAANSWQITEEFASENGLRASMWLSLRNAQGNVIYFNEKYKPMMQDSGLDVHMITFVQEQVKVEVPPDVKPLIERQCASNNYWWVWILLIILVIGGLYYVFK